MVQRRTQLGPRLRIPEPPAAWLKFHGEEPADRGARAVPLEKSRAFTEAIGLYQSAGYPEVAPFNHEAYAHHRFEKQNHTQR